jgi:hypothetical protein
MSALAGAALLGVPQAYAQTSDSPTEPPLPPELIAASPTSVHATMDYGSRAGMEVSVVGMKGRDTAHAVIRIRHTRDNAIAFCRDYVRNVTEECVQETLAEEKGLKDAITGNCDSGEFTDFYGVRYRFLGPNPKSGYFGDNRYLIMNLATREIADGSTRSRYLINMDVYRALCPAHAPLDLDTSVVSMAGRDTANSVMRVKHTRADAMHSCQEYGTVQTATEDCIREELAKRIDDVVTANCISGEFIDFYGNRYRVSLKTNQVYPASKVNILNLATGEIVDPFTSNHKIRQPLPLYRALCPAHAPI